MPFVQFGGLSFRDFKYSPVRLVAHYCQLIHPCLNTGREGGGREGGGGGGGGRGGREGGRERGRERGRKAERHRAVVQLRSLQ